MVHAGYRRAVRAIFTTETRKHVGKARSEFTEMAEATEDCAA
jgi:hypothetical protein